MVITDNINNSLCFTSIRLSYSSTKLQIKATIHSIKNSAHLFSQQLKLPQLKKEIVEKCIFFSQYGIWRTALETDTEKGALCI